MPSTGRLFANDEELGKKDDEYRPGANGKLPSLGYSWPAWRISPRMRRRRILVVATVFFAIFLFVKNLPGSTIPIAYRVDRRDPYRTVNGLPLAATYSHFDEEVPKGAPPVRPKERETKLGKHYYNGRIKWFHLAGSLTHASRSMGYRIFNQNVMFAAANPQSIARLIPFACEMARYNRNIVHVVLLGRDELSIDEYKEINGIDDTCLVYWHDARPDYAAYSTDWRMEENTYNALTHVYNYLKPHVYIVEDLDLEDPPFARGIESHASEVGKSMIRLPENALSKLMWATRLDAGALAAWHNTFVEILIHARPDSSGSLIRLLRSIEKADYFGIRHPHITIELPSRLDQAAEQFLDDFVWPPQPETGGTYASQLTLRRRIPSNRLSPSEASIRMVESFYPARNRQAHVLVLSPQAELSELYYHYLIYNLLEYKYATYGAGTWELERLMGISLNLPARLLDDKTHLIPPVAVRDGTKKARKEYSPFLWQAPDTHATLYFGDKWRELHSFLSYRSSKATAAITKTISPNFPALAEHLLELMRARNYFVLYPHVKDYAIVTVHNELYRPPEEFAREDDDLDGAGEADEALPADTDDPFLMPPAPSRPPPAKENFLIRAPLHKVLPEDGDLPELWNLPILSYQGRVSLPDPLERSAKSFREYFRTTIGACPPRYDPNILQNSAQDLFCYGDDDYLSMTSDDSGSGDGIPDGFGGGARGRGALDDDWELGDPFPVPVSEGEKEQMLNEFERHLQRQNKKGQSKDESKSSAAKGKTRDEADPAKKDSNAKGREKDGPVASSTAPDEEQLERLPETAGRSVGQAVTGPNLEDQENERSDEVTSTAPEADASEGSIKESVSREV